jgi:hypothetical protein
MGKTGRRSRGGLAAQVKENVPGGLGRRADVTGELRRRAPTSSSSPTADAAARENHHLRGLLEAAGAQQQPAARWLGAGTCSSRVENRIGTACAVAERWSGRHVRCWQLVPPACPCAHCICMDACLACVHVDAGGSSACRELPAMAAEYAGHSAACCMLARAIDGVSRVCCVFCIVFVMCPRWCREMRFGDPCVVRDAGDLLSIYILCIQKLYISRFPRRIGSCGRRNIDTKRQKSIHVLRE